MSVNRVRKSTSPYEGKTGGLIALRRVFKRLVEQEYDSDAAKLVDVIMNEVDAVEGRDEGFYYDPYDSLTCREPEVGEALSLLATLPKNRTLKETKKELWKFILWGIRGPYVGDECYKNAGKALLSAHLFNVFNENESRILQDLIKTNTEMLADWQVDRFIAILQDPPEDVLPAIYRKLAIAIAVNASPKQLLDFSARR